MGLVVLESLFYALSVSCYEFSHLKCRDFMKQILRTTVCGNPRIVSCDFRVMFWKALKRFSGINFRMVSSFVDVLSGKGALIGIRTH